MADTGFSVFTYADYDGEKSSVRVRAAALTVGNIVAQTTLHDNVLNGIGGITLGLAVKQTMGNEELLSISPSDDQDAQREFKWLVQYHDDTTFDRYTLELPCADVSKLDANDRGNAEIGDADVVDAFITAFEAYALTKAGNAAVVDEITLVGRNV